MTEKCRICLTEATHLDFINISNKLNEETTIMECILTVSSIQVSENDTLPQSICSQCYIKLHEFFLFCKLIISSDKKLKEHLECDSQNGKQININALKSYDQEEESQQDVYLGPKIENDADSVESSDVKLELEANLTDIDCIDSDVNEKQDENAPQMESKKFISRKCKSKITKLAKRHECLDCGKTFKKADHLNVHIAYKHSEKQFKCETCNKKFARKYDLTYHSRVHTGERPFTCELCGKSFASSSYFYMHKRMHSGQKKMKCDLCQNSFINSDQLQIHIRQKHTGERPFLCELCSHAFSSSSALFRHKRDVHDQKVECPICKKLYSSRVLKDHIKRHKEREEGIKRFSCDLCGRRFTCATSRKRHLVIHSGEKAFKCEVCEKAFNQRSTLQTHMRIHSQIMPFQCDTCSKNFRYKHHLKLHCEKHHQNEQYDENIDMYKDQ